MMILAFAAIGFSAFASEPTKHAASTSVKVDVAQSTFKWHAEKVTGKHEGTMKFLGGEVQVEKNTLVGGTFNVDMTSMECTDLSGEWHDKLLGHLKSDDFFAVDKFKTAVLTIQSAEPIKGAKPGENNYTIKAGLTIKGITKEVTFPAMVIITKGQVIANADFMIDRTKYDIRYGSKSFIDGIGDKAINDEFNVKVRVVAVQQMQ